MKSPLYVPPNAMAVRKESAFSNASFGVDKASAALRKAVRLRLSKNPGELERAEALSNFQSSPAACTVGAGLFYRREIPFPGEKIATLQILRPESERLKQNLEGVVVAGELAPPSTSLSKRLF